MDAVDYCVEITDGKGRWLAGDWATAESQASMEADVAEAFAAFRMLQATSPAFARFSISCKVRPAEDSAWVPSGVVVSAA